MPLIYREAVLSFYGNAMHRRKIDRSRTGELVEGLAEEDGRDPAGILMDFRRLQSCSFPAYSVPP
jgi:hypothetical protein